MKVIKKSENKVKAHCLIDGFLTRCQEGGQWPTDLYQELSSDKDANGKKTFDQFRDELLKESNGLCCYCMRKLSITNTTLEHIIPNKLETEDEYNKYQHYYSQNEWAKMIFSKSFLQQPYWPQSSYPHTIAYENLVPSCDGKMADLRTSDEKAKHIGDSRDSKCCNIKRGNDFVPPFIFSESMCKEFEYRNNGLLIWNDASPKEAERKRKVVADTLGLNCEELRTIRRIWFFLASNHYACNGISQEEKEAILLCIAAFAKPTERDSIYKFQNPKYWDLLEEYDFFNDTSKFTI